VDGVTTNVASCGGVVGTSALQDKLRTLRRQTDRQTDSCNLIVKPGLVDEMKMRKWLYYSL
jgi:hypothetical protein